MAFHLTLLLAVVTLSLAIDVVDIHKSVIAIYEGEDGADLSCVNGTESQSSLASLPNKLGRNVELRICSSVMLRSNISLTGVRQVAITGYENPIIQCLGNSSVSLTVTGALKLELTNFTLKNCELEISYQLYSATSHRFSGASVLIQNCSNVNAYNINIMNGENTHLQVRITRWSQGNIQSYLFPSRNQAHTFVRMSSTNVISPDNNSLSCAPGLVHNQSVVRAPCVCSINTKHEYYGISKCDRSQAFLKRGFWIGYDSTNESEDSLVSGYCPPSFCSREYGEDLLLLPDTADREILSKNICSSTRNDTLCGKCITGHSVFYHSLNFKCKSNKHCTWGWFFYILSEILPVTFLFLVIIHFNIPFTSGLFNGFIFFSQVVEMFQVTADNFIPLSDLSYIFTRIHYLIYLFFNLDTLILDEISYCIWSGATALDVLAFSYVTLVYSFVLIISVILVMNRCTCKNGPSARSSSSQFLNLQGSIIHGLTAFLVLFFAHSVRASIFILAPMRLFGKGRVFVRTVVTYNGIEWMGRHHLPYAIPAIFILAVIATPPLLLLVYPIHYKLLGALKIAENKYVKIIFCPLERMKPFLDSFQGCFKDRYRFFAGLYFVYRFSFLLNMTTYRFTDTYFYTSVLLSFMLILHALCQPYKKQLHNNIDTLLFGNLAMINAITAHNYSDSTFAYTSGYIWIQIILIFMPLLIVLICLFAKCLSQVCICNRLQRPVSESSQDLGDSDTPVLLSYGSLNRRGSSWTHSN